MRDGWFRSGDIGVRDADGYYTIVDRAKDMIIRGGFNVYPREVEEVLMTHPAVSLAAVVGVPHESHGEEIKAYVIRLPGATETEDDLIAWAKENMAAYKYPRVVEFRDALPMTATGKILKRELR
jgi:long-chain acyl-CoA synthetase